MTAPQPAWAESEWSSRIDEPFRSDHDFWVSLATSADACIAVVVAAATAVVLVLSGNLDWSALPFLAPSLLALRAAFAGRTSSRRSRLAFADEHEWRDAERNAVAVSFGHALVRRRLAR